MSMKVPAMYRDVIKHTLDGFENYTVDERGDVGSWVRLVAIESTYAFVEQATEDADSPSHHALKQDSIMDLLVAQLLKQAVEKLDVVREAAMKTLTLIASRRDKLQVQDSPVWDQLWSAFQRTSSCKSDDAAVSEAILDRNQGRQQRGVAHTLLPFVDVPAYKDKLLEGAILSGVRGHLCH